MKTIRIFISSVQKEFAQERAALRDYLRGDPLFRQFYDVFLFEDVPAQDRRADELYLDEVKQCDIYIGLFGCDYGSEDVEGLSPTQREFDLAGELSKPRLIFVKKSTAGCHPKMVALIDKAGSQLIRRHFTSMPELIAAVYASLVHHLEDVGCLRTRPFDATAARNSTLEDISPDKVQWFLSRARNARDYALAETTSVTDVLTHLDLFYKGTPNHAAILLFGVKPQRFLISSELKCMHFHTLEKRKPIPSYQIYKGTIFDMVDKAVDFVMSKLNRSVGTRELGPQAPVEYDIPQEVVAEGIVNAVAHRDYTSNASVEVQLFPDRLEIWNPGTVHPPLTLEKLLLPHASQPNNPLIAEPLFLTKYIEKAGTGTVDMLECCRKAGLRQPEFRIDAGFFILTIWRKKIEAIEGKAESIVELLPDRHHVGTMSALSLHQVETLNKCLIDTGITELMEIAGRTDRTKFRNHVLNPLIEAGFLEMTVPDKPRSSKQKYRVTEKGQNLVTKQKNEES
ncbi:MAG: ATP-binding protein [Methanosarcinaceae archaeon]|nr:ATP-binding protein [Methanosarcinaceae archaeon]